MYALILLFLSGCSLIPTKTVYKTVEVPVPVEVIEVIKQPNRCEKPEQYFETWGELLIMYTKLSNAFDLCIDSLE